jgi:glycosyltransferase involved in cell wall biosynthesis
MPADSTAVTVVVATFNRGCRIAKTIDSIRRQSRTAGEIIVVDDGSTDGTGDWVEGHYPDVRVIRTVNQGTSAARNCGARHATCDLLLFLDHDDELLPGAIETLTDLLRTFAEARAAFADHTYINIASGVSYANHHSAQPAFARLRRVESRRASGAARLYDRPVYRALLHGNLLQQPWVIYRDTFNALGGFSTDVRYCEDWDIYLRLTARVPVALSDAVISNHYVEGGNLHLAPGQAEMQMLVLRKQLALRKASDLDALITLRSRLAMYYKTAGDTVRRTDRRRALWCYARSFALWPFDHVVAIRTLWWLLSLPVTAMVFQATPTRFGNRH